MPSLTVAPPDAITDLERLRTVLTLVGKRLAGTDPILIQTGPLDSIDGGLQAQIAALAAYAAAQADKQMSIETKNRRLELELAAIGPYLAPLPEPDQHAFRLALGNRTFGVESLSDKPTSVDQSSPASAIEAIIKSPSIRDWIVEIVKSVGHK
jgi:hypothetical protein